MRYPVYHYQTPEGYSDFPFTYIFDGNSLQDGVNLSQVKKALHGDSDFILRDIMGLEKLVDTPANGGRVQLYNASGTFMSDKPMIPPPVLPIVPEKLYQFKDVIRFDLYHTKRYTFQCLNPPFNGFFPDAFVAFRGVKRFTGTGFNVETTYEYREVPQIYIFEVILSFTPWQQQQSNPAFTGVLPGDPPRRFFVPIQNWDFELQRVLACQDPFVVNVLPNSDTPAPLAGPPPFALIGPVMFDQYLLQIYDSQGHQTSDLPVPITMISSAGGTTGIPSGPSGTGSPPGLAPYRSVFPVPPLVYPAGSRITFDLYPQTCQGTPIQILFEGVWRIPCSGGNLPQGEV